jgi:deoxyinosine 3'endonuclease (endonuclease V)
VNGIEMPEWPKTVSEAVEMQERLRVLVDRRDSCPGTLSTVTGVDVAYDEATNLIAASAVSVSPRRIDGLAVIGVAKTRLIGEYTEPGESRGASSVLVDDRQSGGSGAAYPGTCQTRVRVDRSPNRA